MEDNEREKTAVTALLEEFRARSADQVSIQTEQIRWLSLYGAAVVAGLCWLIASPQDIDVLFARHQDAAVLGLAALNDWVALSVALRSWWIHQLQLYSHEITGAHVRRLTGVPFNTFDEWRRSGGRGRLRGSVDVLRLIGYFVVAMVPLLVSAIILWKSKTTAAGNARFVVRYWLVVILTVATLVYSFAVMLVTDRRWKAILDNSE